MGCALVVYARVAPGALRDAGFAAQVAGVSADWLTRRRPCPYIGSGGKTWSRLHRSSGHMRSYGVQATHVERQSSW